MNSKEKQKIIIIGGPTASGKSTKALELAEQENGEIINCDSLQIYNDLPILTAQPSPEDYKNRTHHLYAHLHPNDVCSAGNWNELVRPLISSILEKNKTPIICGGTGLYIRALMEGLSPMPDIPDDIRNTVVEHYEQIGAERFYAELEKRDPVMARRFHVNHKARIIRAYEVLEATGQSLAEWQKIQKDAPPKHWDFEVITIIPERDILYKQCNLRFEQMLDKGALEEVESFQRRIETDDVKSGVPLTKALGFKQLRDYIKGKINKEDAITAAQTETRHYAKRQTTWFRNQI
jgi:tRNA dimethylallyltransferase